ncbi:MAG: nitroreductase/quinone reductase family protein [Nocardioides sp.]
MQLRRVDPGAPKSVVRRGLEAFGRSRVGRWYGIRIAAPMDARLLKATGGRVRLVASLPTALLQTTGAKSGQLRETPVVYFHPEPTSSDVVLIASSFGRDKHPAWFHNLTAHPECLLNGQAFTAIEVSDPGERDRLYGLATQVYAGYADYEVHAAAAGRTIPVLRLRPAH